MQDDAAFVTYTGREVDLENLSTDMICLQDLAHHLSLICRFAGAVKTFYSVAEHCMYCDDLYIEMCKGKDKLNIVRQRLLLMLHDAHEFITGDIPSYPKMYAPEISLLQKRIDEVIFAKFKLDNVSLKERTIVKIIDWLALKGEAKILLPSGLKRILDIEKKQGGDCKLPVIFPEVIGDWWAVKLKYLQRMDKLINSYCDLENKQCQN